MAQQTVSKMERVQTAVEWLKQEYKISGLLTEDDFIKAKEIEKKQREEEILNAIIFSEKEHFSNSLYYPTQYVVKKAEQYYNETFGGQEIPDTSPNTQNK